MNRRELFQALAGIGVACVAVTAVARKHGLLTVESHLAHKRLTGEDLHVYVDGVDVTSDCYEAHDVDGYALVYCREPHIHNTRVANGAVHCAEGRVCAVRMTGAVVMVAGDPL